MTYFVAVDIGCIECGESSEVLGIFLSEEKAHEVCKTAADLQQKNWSGQHSFEVFPVSFITE